MILEAPDGGNFFMSVGVSVCWKSIATSLRRKLLQAAYTANDSVKQLVNRWCLLSDMPA